MIRVLLVDDHAVVRQGLKMFLALDPDLVVVGEAANGAQALDQVASLRPDVVLMDIKMPVMDGLTAIRRIRGTYPDTEVIAVTSVLENTAKDPWFTAEGRVLMIQREVSGLGNVRVVRFAGLLVDLAAKEGAEVVVRGVRGGSDLEYETLMARMNAHLHPGLETVFLPSSPQLTHIASRLVREIAYLGGSVKGLVTEKIALAVEVRAEERRADRAFKLRGPAE